MVPRQRHGSDTVKIVECPRCGQLQRVCFPGGSVGIEQRCQACGRYCTFSVPSGIAPLKRLIRR